MDSQPVSLRVDRSDLADAVTWVAKSIPTNPTQPVLRAMVLTAGDEGLEIAGFDYEISSRVKLAAEIAEPGRVAVAGRLLADIVGTLPRKPVELQVNGSILLLSCGAARFELPLIPLDDYPQIPDLPEVTGTIEPSLFVEAITQVAAAAGRDDTLPMLTGINMQIDGDRIELAATDRFRLAVRNLEWNPKVAGVEAKLLVPAKSLQENARSLDLSLDQPLEIAVGTEENLGGDGLFGLHTAQRETTTRMLDADFPNIQPLLPKIHNSLASVDTGLLLEALNRVRQVAGRNAQIRLEFSREQVVLSASDTDNGHAEEVIPCAFVGQDSLIIAFNPGYLKDGLSVIRTERVVFGFTESARPAILIPEPEELPEANEDGQFPTPDTAFTYLLMPVRLPG